MAPSTKLDLHNQDAKAKNAKMNEEREFFTKLLEATNAGQSKTVQQLVEEYVQRHSGVSKMDVLMQFRNAQKRTVLHFACQSEAVSSKTDEEDIVLALLSPSWHGSSSQPSELQIWVRLKDVDGLTPLMMAARHVNGAVSERRIAALLQVEPTLALVRSHAGATALHYAAGSAAATPAAVMQLYEAGKVALETPSNKGGTPLHWAAGTTTTTAAQEEAVVQIVSTLVETCGANVMALDERGFSPLLLAMASSHDAVAKTLLQRGADRSTLLQGNITLFHMAADLNLVGTLAALLEPDEGKAPEESLAAKCCAMNNHEGYTPLDLAAKEGHVGCVLLLLPPDYAERTEETAKAYIQDRQAEFAQKKDTANPPNDDNDDRAGATTSTTPNVQQQEEDVRLAVEQLQKKHPPSSKADQDEAMALKQKGNAHVAKQEWRQAMEWYDKAIQLHPTEATFYSNRSACRYSLAQYPEALQDGLWAKCLRPQWSKAHYRIAVARLALEEYEDAAVAAFDGLALHPENDELKALVRKCVQSGRVAHHPPNKAGTPTPTKTTVHDLPNDGETQKKKDDNNSNDKEEEKEKAQEEKAENDPQEKKDGEVTCSQ